MASSGAHWKACTACRPRQAQQPKGRAEAHWTSSSCASEPGLPEYPLNNPQVYAQADKHRHQGTGQTFTSHALSWHVPGTFGRNLELRLLPSGVHLNCSSGLQREACWAHATMCNNACLFSMCRTSSTGSKGEGRDLVERLTIQRLRNGAAAARDELQAVLKQTKRQHRQNEQAQHQQQAQIRGLKSQVVAMERQWQVQVSLALSQQVGMQASCACRCLQNKLSLVMSWDTTGLLHAIPAGCWLTLGS